MRSILLACALAAAAAAPGLAAEPAVQLETLDAQSYLREAARDELLILRAAELAEVKARAATVMSLGIRLSRDQRAATQRLEAAAAELGRPAPQDLDEPRAAIVAELKRAQGLGFDQAFLALVSRVGQRLLELHGAYAASGAEPDLRAYAAESAARARQRLAMLRAM